jgi:hypothetical protein
MTNKKLILSVFILALLTVSIQTANAQGKGYDKIVKHLETNYQAKKVRIPFMWLAKIAVKVVRPAGVKSFNVTLFENLTFKRATLDQEMQSAMSDSLGADWSPIIRVRSREGEQVYMYMREEGENVRIMFVAIDKNNATVVRAKFNAEKFIEFLNNPRIMGISLGDKKEEPKPEETKPPENRK